MSRKYTIEKEFHFSASHVLSGLPNEHPCARLHGHNYVVVVQLTSGQLDGVGFVKDYRELDEVKEFIDDNLDHRHLNDVFNFNPTAENMAHHLYERFKKTLPQLSRVSVKETPKTVAHYENQIQ